MNARDVERLYRAFIRGDEAVVRSALAPDAWVAIAGHDGSGADDAVAAMKALQQQSPGFRTWNDDSADFLVSEYHGVVLDRWLADGDRDQQITMLAADVREDGTIGVFSFYGHDNDGIRSFFAA